jgi:hypothetical protein
VTLNLAANRAKKGLESELENLQDLMDSHMRAKQEVNKISN